MDYPKAKKIKIVYKALTLERKDILGDTPPPSSAREVQHLGSSIKKRGKWKLEKSAELVYIIARHVHNHREKLRKKGSCVSTDFKVIVLGLMYSYFINEVNLAKAIRQSQNKAMAKSLQQQGTKSTKPLPPNF